MRIMIHLDSCFLSQLTAVCSDSEHVRTSLSLQKLPLVLFIIDGQVRVVCECLGPERGHCSQDGNQSPGGDGLVQLLANQVISDFYFPTSTLTDGSQITGHAFRRVQRFRNGKRRHKALSGALH